jgi:hypothetical protein
VDDDRGLLAAGAGEEAGDALVVGDADGYRRQWTDEPLRPPVERRAPPAAREERPAVDGEDADRDSREPGRHAAEDPGLRAARVEDVRARPAQEPDELEQAEQVSRGIDRAPDVPEGDEARSGGARGVLQRPGPVGCDGDVEAPHERGQQRRDVGLRPARLRQRYDKNETRPPRAHAGKRTTPLVLGLLGVGVFLAWAGTEGGYAPTAWYPGALVYLSLLVAVAAWPARRAMLPRPAAVALALLAAFGLWSLLSVSWAGVKGDAWDGGNRTLMYASVYAAFALPRWRPAHVAGLFAVFAIGVTAIGAGVLVLDGASAFIGNRFADPMGYANANAALFLAAFWPALALAARPELHWALRSLLLASGGVALQLAVLAQSRASFAAGFAALALHLLLSPERRRAVLTLLPVAAVTLASLDALLDVYASRDEAELRSAVARETWVLALSGAALMAAGALWGVLERRFARGRLLLPAGRRLLAAAAAAALVLGLAASTAAVGFPGSRFTGGAESGRYDVWRVAAEEVADHPVLGVGADNFAVDYLRERRTDEELLYPHSVVLRAASQTGLVGAALFLGFLAAAFAAAMRARRTSDYFARAVASAAVVAAAYWLLHGSVDWFWEVPALTAPALAGLALASGLASERARALRRRRGPRRLIAAVAGAAAALVFVSYALPGLAAFEVERAVRSWPEEPGAVWTRLEAARELNRLSERPDVIEGVFARRAGQPGRERRAFARALERNPHDWYVHLRLALVANDGDAAVHLRRARSRDPRGGAVDAVEEAVLADAPVERQLLDAVDRLAIRTPLGRAPATCRPVGGVGARCHEKRR